MKASDLTGAVHRRILTVGAIGSGKTAQVWTLPGKKFCYVFDPNAASTLAGMENCEIEFFQSGIADSDQSLKGFNKGAKSDKVNRVREPTTYMRWVDDLNKRVDAGAFKEFDWLVFDSLTFLSKSIMDRQLFLNGRFGDIEELGDFRIVGSKLADLWNSIASLPINIYATGHLSTFQDELTKRIETQLYLPGKARTILPLLFTDIWLARVGEAPDAKSQRYEVVTRPEARGMKDLRCSFRSLKPVEDVTIARLDASATQHGIGRLLKQEQEYLSHGIRKSSVR